MTTRKAQARGRSCRGMWVGLLSAALVVACSTAGNRSAEPLASLDPDSRAQYDDAVATLYGAKDRFQYPAAADALAQVVNRSPTFAAGRFHWAYALSKLGRYDDLLVQTAATTEYADGLSPRQRLWLRALSFRAADEPYKEVEAWSAVTQAHPEDRWAWYELASSLSRVERYGEAADAAEKALALEPDPARWAASWIYYLHSKALYRSGQFAAAIPAGANGHSNRSTWRSTFYRQALGEARVNPDRIADLVNEYRAISAAEGRNNAAYTEANIALFYYELGDFSVAANFARASWDAQPSAYAAWALAFALTESGRPEAALAFIDGSAQDFLSNSFLQVARAWALYRVGQLEAALAALETADAQSSRWQYLIEFATRTVKRAIEEPDAKPAEPIPWLG
ncbi:MAG: hypothetical protein AAGH76_12815 [Pseudomonadota bacterium]